jgi:hypothetical protein
LLPSRTIVVAKSVIKKWYSLRVLILVAANKLAKNIFDANDIGSMTTTILAGRETAQWTDTKQIQLPVTGDRLR